MRAALTTVWKPYDSLRAPVYGSHRFQLNGSYVTMLQRSGFQPCAVFPGSDPSGILKGVDLLVLTGGGDPDPALFGEENRGSRNPERDRPLWEMELYREARNLGIPVLGICMGMQIAAISQGIPLIQDLDRAGILHIPHEDPDGDPVVHSVKILEGSVLSEALRGTEEVSSCHHQVIERVPDGFITAAESPDGLIEAMESLDGLVTGVQWHPERDGTGLRILERIRKIAGCK